MLVDGYNVFLSGGNRYVDGQPYLKMSFSSLRQNCTTCLS